tara:strand:+ start:1555 stop:1731 length:177 start_codon:yes stop_codon:yes gene_type:complete
VDIKNVKKQKDQFDNESNILHVITKDDVVTFVPIDSANRHYQAIQEWVAEGNIIEDAD